MVVGTCVGTTLTMLKVCPKVGSNPFKKPSSNVPSRTRSPATRIKSLGCVAASRSIINWLFVLRVTSPTMFISPAFTSPGDIAPISKTIALEISSEPIPNIKPVLVSNNPVKLKVLGKAGSEPSNNVPAFVKSESIATIMLSFSKSTLELLINSPPVPVMLENAIPEAKILTDPLLVNVPKLARSIVPLLILIRPLLANVLSNETVPPSIFTCAEIDVVTTPLLESVPPNQS